MKTEKKKTIIREKSPSKLRDFLQKKEKQKNENKQGDGELEEEINNNDEHLEEEEEIFDENVE